MTMQFGGVVAVNNLSLEVNRGEIVALIGPNGAGKTTAFNCITGVYEPTNGQVFYEDKLIANHHTTEEIARLIGADSLGFLPLESLSEMSGCPAFCSACFDGNYPTKIPADPRKDRFEARRGTVLKSPKKEKYS